ncbi:B12-binding domain-containing radical SAM protein [Desulfonatronum parangueonense]
MTSILFVYPPIAKPSEPPAGIAVLAGVLRGAGVGCAVVDMNLEGMLALMKGPVHAADTWTLRAVRNREKNLELIRRPETYAVSGRYQRTVADLNRVLEKTVSEPDVHLSLANYQDDTLSPTRSADLLQAAEHPETNPFFHIFASRLTEAMDEFQPGAVGFSLNYLSQALCTMAMVGYVRRQWPGLAIILGGGLVTSWMQGPSCHGPDDHAPGDARGGPSLMLDADSMQRSYKYPVHAFTGLVDEMVSGPGEEALLQRFGKIDAANPAHATPDFSDLPLTEYFSPGPILPYSASRGCYWNRCAFCPEKAEGNRYAPVPRSVVASDLRILVNKVHPVLIHLLDNAVSPAMMRELIRRPPGAPWYGFARFNRQLAEPDFCRELRRAGCVMLKLGLESGSQSVLDGESKGVDLALAERVLENLRSAGIGTYVYLLFGTPSESEAEARETLDFVARNHRGIGFLNLAIFNLPLAGRGRAGLDVIPHGNDDLSLYAGFHHPLGWDRAKVRRFLDREFRRHPAIAPILRRDPPIFTSNHAPFFLKK